MSSSFPVEEVDALAPTKLEPLVHVLLAALIFAALAACPGRAWSA